MNEKEYILKKYKGVNHNTMFSLWEIEQLMEAYAKQQNEQLTKELELYKQAIQNIHVRCKNLAKSPDNDVSSKAYFMTCKDIAEHEQELAIEKIEQLNKENE